MPARIVNMDDLVPDELVFNYHGKDYRLPGDIDTETVFTLEQLLIEMAEAEGDVLTAMAANVESTSAAATKKAQADQKKAKEHQRRVTRKTEAEILGLFQVNHPELEKLPFGVVGFTVVLTYVLAELGFAQAPAPDPTPPRPNRETRRAKSRPLNTSRSS
jgi:hypothetical protein